MRVQIWRTQSDGKVRESHRAMEGVRVAIDEPFKVAGERLFLPCDTQGSFEETAGCRCQSGNPVGFLAGDNWRA